VRDLDVFRCKAQHYLDSLPQERQDDLAPLLATWKEQHNSARTGMLAYLASDRYSRFKEGVRALLDRPGAVARPAISADGQPLAHRLRHVAPVAVYERLVAVRAFDEGVTLAHVPLEGLHCLRIAAKGLRYTLEFLREVLGPEAESVIDVVKKLQDHLGDLQDAVVASGLLRDFLTWGTWGHRANGRAQLPTEPVVAPGVATYLAARQAEIQQLLSGFPAVWEEVADQRFQQQLAAALAVLW